DSAESPVVDFIDKVLNVIPDVWKEWIAHSKLTETEDHKIVEVLAGNGYNRESAAAEVNAASLHPYLISSARTHARRGKAVCLLNIQGQLARFSTQASTVERRAGVGRAEFLDRYYAANRPVIIQQLMTDWNAPALWTSDYLKGVAGADTVEVMTGRNADPACDRNPDKHRTEMPFAEYIDMVYSGKTGNDYYITPENDLLGKLAAKPLLNDFHAFPEYLDCTTTASGSSLWFGPGGTVTKLHHDFCNTLFAQISGRKVYRLVPAARWDCVYNSTGNFADVDAGRPDWSRHSRYRNASVAEVILLPGETLFVPVGWWSYVRALDVSLTISFTNFRFPNQYEWQ